ncbi:MAG: hypothetical protein IT258_22375 [Saprospiraceae bacterium]|nr:hypothetical protein [Saprospiraceae bacterium]
MKKRPKVQPITQDDPKQQQKEKLRERLLVACIVAWLIYNCTRPNYIGTDIRYLVFVMLIPILGGILVLGLRKSTISKIWNNPNTFSHELQGIGISLFLYLFASFFSFGLLAKIVWDTANRLIVQDKQVVVIQCPITKFGAHGKSRRTKHVNFEFNGHSEQINISSDTMLLYEDKIPTNYNILLETKEGLWNHYLVLGYSIHQK